MANTPPFWVIGNAVQHVRGFRLPNIKILDKTERCELCTLPFGRLETKYRFEDKWICRPCDQRVTAAKHRAELADSTKKAIIVLGPAPTTSPIYVREMPGNIENSLYRYLVGTRTTISKMVYCRACGSTLYHGMEELKEHNKRTQADDPAHQNMGCSGRLVKAYKLILEKKECIVCRRKTYDERWGIPICKGKCTEDWKFEQRRWPALIEGLIEEFQIRLKEKEAVVL